MSAPLDYALRCLCQVEVVNAHCHPPCYVGSNSRMQVPFLISYAIEKDRKE